MKSLLMILAVPILAFGLLTGNSYAHMGGGTKSTAAEFRASKIIGLKVEDQQGKKVGEIKDLITDPQEPGRIIFAVLDPARSLEFGHDRLMAIPFNALLRSGMEHVYVLNMTRDKLAKAPSFDEDHWPNPADRSWSAEVYRYYGLTPYWTGLK